MTDFSSPLQESLLALPSCPGVYEMKTKGIDGEKGETLYVGKAKNLKSRVKSYFLPSSKHSIRIQKLIEKIHHIEWTETGSEIEALILENNLIKEKYPKFNILLRDDKTYAYIKITNEDFPRILLVRKVVKDGAKYFGPKTSTKSVRNTIDVLQDILQFRSTPIEIFEKINEAGEKYREIKSGNQKYPCLNYHLKKCEAPCLGNISKETYNEKVKNALSFLRGNTKHICETVQNKMMEYAKNGKFELAAKQRDILISIEKISEKQIISTPNEFSADIIGSFSHWGHMFFHVFSLREGKIINSETFPIHIKNESTLDPLPFLAQQEALHSFLKSHISRVSDIPKTIIIDSDYIDETEKEIWEDFFTHQWEQKTEISLPQKGKRKEILLLAHQNAESYAKRHAMSFLKNNDDNDEILENLQKKLQMKRLPKRIECYDISHFSGIKTVASMVVFIDGNAKNSDYRSFNIKTVKEGDIDDFKSLAEALSRRLSRLPEKYPKNWSIEKIKRKKDFDSIVPSFQNLLKCNGKYLESHPIYSKRDKTKQTSFYSLFSTKNKEIINKKTGEISQKNIKYISDTIICFFSQITIKDPLEMTIGEIYLFDNNEEITIEEMQSWRFLLENIFIKGRCKKYKVYTENKKIKEFLEHLGFQKNINHCQELPNRYPTKSNYEKLWTEKIKDSFASIPDLLVIDGGKGQLSATWNILKKSVYKNEIAICSLAKREEEVFSIDRNGEMYKTSIEKKSAEGMILQRIRDEAHRFAITKNRTGREKIAQKSILDGIKGIGGKTKKNLKQKFGGVSGIRKASDEELLKVVNKKILKRLRDVI